MPLGGLTAEVMMSVSAGSAAGKEDQPSKTFSAMYVDT